MTHDDSAQAEEGIQRTTKLTRRSLNRAVGAGAITALVGGFADHLSVTGTASATSEESDPYRPEYHFSPSEGWMNDPNGLVYHQGKYHLFYQAGAESRRWDHATSTDLINWTEHGTKISDTASIQAYSGGAVIDENNTAGFGNDALIALYTGHHDDDIEDQRLAYSTNNGRTVQKYEGNPVIPSEVDDWRDPRPFWYEPDDSWRFVITRVDSTEGRPAGIEIYSSDDLLDWTYESTYGSGGERWETPNLLELPVEGSDETRWLMSMSIEATRTVEHHVGRFDGTDFISDEVFRADYGYDFYAPQYWANTPRDRGLFIYWMNNWNYAMDTPDNGWQGAMTVPRTVTLTESDDGIEVRECPAEEMAETRTDTIAELDSETITPSNDPLSGTGITGSSLELITSIDTRSANQVELRVREGNNQASVITYDVDDEELRFDRTNAGEFFESGYYGETSAPLEPLDDGTIELRVLVDRSSVEIFANEGRMTMTNLVFPDGNSTDVSLSTEGGAATLDRLVAYDLATES